MGRMQPTVAGFDDGGKKTQSKECKKLEKEKKWITPKTLQKGTQPCRHIYFSPMRPMLDFILR